MPVPKNTYKNYSDIEGLRQSILYNLILKLIAAKFVLCMFLGARMGSLTFLMLVQHLFSLMGIKANKQLKDNKL